MVSHTALFLNLNYLRTASYMANLADLIFSKKKTFNFHGYHDATQETKSFKPSENEKTSLKEQKKCISLIRS